MVEDVGIYIIETLNKKVEIIAIASLGFDPFTELYLWANRRLKGKFITFIAQVQ